MEELTSHKVNELDDAIMVCVIDEPGQGNACHHYTMTAGGGTPGTLCAPGAGNPKKGRKIMTELIQFCLAMSVCVNVAIGSYIATEFIRDRYL